jgi:hypothetical protein
MGPDLLKRCVAAALKAREITHEQHDLLIELCIDHEEFLHHAYNELVEIPPDE